VAPGAPVLDDPRILEELRAGSDEVTADELELLQRILDSQNEVNQITDRLIEINSTYLVDQREMLDRVERVAQADDRVRRTDEDVARAQERLLGENDRLREDAVAAYVRGGAGGSSAAALLEATSVDDLSKVRVYANAVAIDHRSVVQHYVDLKRNVDDLRRQAEEDRLDAEAARDELSDMQAILEQQRELLNRARDDKQRAVDDKIKLLAEVEAKRVEYEDRIASHLRAREAVQQILNARQRDQVLLLTPVEFFDPPLRSYRLTSRFGNRVHPLYGRVAFHAGIDMSAPSGTPIFAPAAGVVVLASWNDGYGNCIVIEHGSGLGTLYGHLSDYNVEEGDLVTTGQIIGFVGSTGNSTGPHLHWEVRVNGQPQDPIPYLRTN
jgi:murein DD-endopeptidase MepM/ murein hydrolase activator NlpD